MTDHNPIISLFGEIGPDGTFTSEGSMAAGGPLYTCVECGGRVMLLTTERGTEDLRHVAGPEDPPFEVVGEFDGVGIA